MIKAYIAFSVHGTNAFIVAEKVMSKAEYKKLNREFQEVPSRRPGYDKDKDGVKLHWDKLKTRDGNPLRAPPAILKRFNKLGDEGWTIKKDAFIQHHYKRMFDTAKPANHRLNGRPVH